MKNKYQNIMITLSNGQKLLATVPAFCEEGEEFRVVDIKVTAPLQLPEGMSWQDDINTGMKLDQDSAE